MLNKQKIIKIKLPTNIKDIKQNILLNITFSKNKTDISIVLILTLIIDHKQLHIMVKIKNGKNVYSVKSFKYKKHI